MRIIVPALVAGSLLMSVSAHATTACNVAGTWSDSYGFSATFTKKGAGSAKAPAEICSGTYKITSPTLTSTKWDLKGTAKSCPAVAAALTFATGSCTSASGTVSAEGQTLDDTWTKGKATHRAAEANKLLSGLR
jgi:hypothetical protein